MTNFLHRTWKLSFLALLLTVSNETMAWRGMRMPELFVKGRYLMAKDMNGNDSIVNLHGFGQTYSPYFNGYAWCKNPDGTVNWGKTKDASACVKWNKEQISKMLDAGWKVNWMRLHMDPAWSNNDAKVKQWENAHPGKYYSENLIVAFDMDLFKKYLDQIFIPMAEFAIENGIYVVMRPPGVCPENLAIGDEYQQYLIKVWTYVCSHEKLKNNPYVMFELANEPINMKGDDGQFTNWSDGSQKNCTKFFQKIVDEIRAVGCNNILWVPGLCWQQNYQGYVKYPVVDSEDGLGIGYAVHCYPGWYGSDSEVASVEQKVETSGAGYVEFNSGWTNSISGVAAKSPILVTEMDWAPKKYDSSWGKATTGIEGGIGFGANFRFIMDKTGNVSWMLFTDADKLAKYDDSKPDGKTFYTDPEACVRPIYRWYKQYAEIPNYSSYSPEREQHILDSIQQVRDAIASIPWYYPNDEDKFDPNIWEKGSVTTNEDGTFTLKVGQYGFGGFQFTGGRDFSKFRYLVLNLAEAPSSNNWSLRLFDNSGYFSTACENSVNKKTRVVVDLQNAKKTNGVKLDVSHIYILGLWDYGNSPIKIKNIYVTNNADYSPETTGIEDLQITSSELPVYDNRFYNLNGQRVLEPQKGQIYIWNGKKIIK